ncbi:MAG: hypothetical protein ACYCSW_05285 [bacterium]
MGTVEQEYRYKKMKKEHLILLVVVAVLGHIILKIISPKYRKFAEDVMSGISIINLLN